MIKKILKFLLFISSSLFADTFTNTFSTNNFNLQSGQSRTDELYYQCTGRQCIFNYNNARSPAINYQTSGGGTSNLTMEGKFPQGAVYPPPNGSDSLLLYLDGNVAIGSGSNLTINGFSSITTSNNAGLSIDNGSFNFNGTTTNSGSGVEFQGNIALTNHATLTMSNIDVLGLKSFTNDNVKITIDSTSTMDLNVKRFQNIKTFENEGTFSLTGDFYNVGQAFDDSPKLATLNNTGTMRINGNFYNGGTFAGVSNCARGCGGGDIINEGQIELTGDFYNKGWQSNQYQGNPQVATNYSSIELKGGTLKTNTFYNERGNTLKFSANQAGQMGQLQGNLNNQQGSVIADIQGADLNTNYTLITGSVTGLATQDLQVVSGNAGSNDLVAWDLTSDGRGFTLYPAGTTPPASTTPTPPSGGGSGGGTTPSNPSNPDPSNPANPTNPSNPNLPSHFDALKNTLGENRGTILSSLDSVIPNFITYGGSAFMTNLSTEINRGIENSFIHTQAAMTDAIRATKNFKPISFNVSYAPTASIYSDVIAQQGVNVWQNNLDISVFGLGVDGDDASGWLGGLNLSRQWLLNEDLVLKLQANYAYADTKYSQTSLTTKNKSNLFQAGATTRYKFLESNRGRAEWDLGFYGIAGLNESTQDYFLVSLNTKGDYNFYSLELETLLGYRFGEKLSFKPYIGINNNYNIRTKIQQNGLLNIQSPSHKYYGLNAIAGAEMQYNLNNGYLYSRIQHERNLYNSNDAVNFYLLDSGILRYELEKIFKTSFSLGAMYFLSNFWSIGLEGTYIGYSDGIRNFGGSLILRYLF